MTDYGTLYIKDGNGYLWMSPLANAYGKNEADWIMSHEKIEYRPGTGFWASPEAADKFILWLGDMGLGLYHFSRR